MGERHITKIARALIGKFQIKPEAMIDPRDPSAPSGFYLWNQYGLVLVKELRRMKPETIGRIAAQGLSFEEAKRLNKTSMLITGTATIAVGAYGDSRASGKAQLVHLAINALLAEMFDILRSQIELSPEEQVSFFKIKPFLLKK